MNSSAKSKSYGASKTITASFDDAIAQTTVALKAQGFGVLTTIDVRKTLKEKIDVDFRPYVILGACNPHLAYRGLTAEPELGLLLPCNVIVQETASGIQVSAVDPSAMLSVAGDIQELREVADEAQSKLSKAIASL